MVRSNSTGITIKAISFGTDIIEPRHEKICLCHV